jgi:hypothetical protein
MLKSTLEDNGVYFAVEAHTNYTGSHGPIVSVEVCAEQDPETMCSTTGRPISVGDNDVARARLPIHAGGMMGFPLNRCSH